MKMNIKKIIGLNQIKSLIFAGITTITMAFSFVSCANSIDKIGNIQNEQIVLKISLNNEDTSSRTILPTFSKSNLTDIKLYGKASTNTGTLSANNNYLLKSWNTYAELVQDNGVILNSYDEKISGTWTFLLTADSNGSSMSATSETISLTTTTINAISFNLTVDTYETTGAVKIELNDLEDFYVAYVKYHWGTHQINANDYTDYTSSETAELSVTTDETLSKSAVFEKSNVTAGNYYLTLFFFNSEKKLILAPWQASVIVQAGALSYKEITPSIIVGSNYVILKTYTITYNFNNDTTENNTYEQTYYPSSTLLGEYSSSTTADTTYTGTAPTGKKFRGWNTKADGTGTRYSPGDNPTLTSNLTLYAQWTTYDDTNAVWTISDADEFQAFFSYSEDMATTYGSSNYPVKLLNNITDLSDWTAVSYYGSFNGNSKSITYTLASQSSTYASLFATLGGTVQNLTITGLSSRSSSNGYVGGLASIAKNATVKNVEISNSTISGTYASYVGGLVGYAENSTLGTSISPNKITKVEATGSTSSTYKTKTGAFAGYIKDSNIASTTVAYSKVTGYYAGGVVGYADATTVGNASYKISTATITTNDSYPITGYYVGAITGYNNAYISNPAINNTTVTTTSYGAYLGGISGHNSGVITKTSYSETFNSAKIVGDYYASYVGGVVGYNEGSIIGVCIDKNTEITSTKSNAYVGNIIGYNNPNVVNKSSETAPVSEDIDLTAFTANTIFDKNNDTLSNGYTRTYTITLEKTSLVHFELKDSSGGNKTNKETLKLLDENKDSLKTFVSSSTPNVDKYYYLNAGTYSLTRYNGNAAYTSYMDITVTSY